MGTRLLRHCAGPSSWMACFPSVFSSSSLPFHIAPEGRAVLGMCCMASLTIDAILDAAEQHQASDVFLQEGEAPRLKIREQIMLLEAEPMSLPNMVALWQVCG